MDLRNDEVLVNGNLQFPEPLINPSKLQTTQLKRLVDEIKRNLWGCDLFLCLFVTALHSYRSDRCLRPFPPFYLNNTDKDFEALRTACDKIPPLKTFLNEPTKWSDEIVQLLSWLLIDSGYPVLKRVQLTSVTYPSQLNKRFKPHYVFELSYQDKAEEMWQRRRGSHQIILAYHGSTVDNFYSILKVGLQQHFSLEKVLLFGTGIYLSSDISVSVHHSPFVQTWQNSELGTKHSVIAICEIINDVNRVKYKDSQSKRNSEDLPEKYFVVTDSDMVRVKYLMVYSHKNNFSMKHYLIKHIFVITLGLYVMLIVVMKLYNSMSSVKLLKWYNQWFK